MPDTDLTPHRTSSSDYQTQCTTLEHLEVEAKAGRVVLRVYSQSSACRLNWTGEGETSGFSSLNHHLGALTPTAYADALISKSVTPDPRPAPHLPRGEAASSGRQRLVDPSFPMRPVASTPNVPPRPAASNPTLPQLPVAVVSELVALSEGPVPPAPATGNLPSRPRRPLPRPPPKLVPSTGSTSTAFLALPTLVLAPAASAPRAPFPESPMPDLTSPKASRSSYTPWANWTDGFYLRQTIIDHTNKRVQATFDVPWDEMQVGADGLSPWISASRDPGWAVWEVARRLAQVPGESVHIAVIAMQPKALLTPARGAAGEVVLDPYATLLDCKRKNIGTATQGRMTNNAKEAVERSLFGVNASSEVLFYGRIFADSIVSVMEFTHDHLPLGLPPHWLAQPGKTWMDSLVWDPYEQAYDWHNARQRIATVAAGGELPSLGKLTTRTSYAPHPSVTRRGTISSVNISIHTGQNGDLEDIAPGAHTVPTDAKVHSTYSRPAEPKTILNPAPPKMPRAARQRPRDTPPRHQRQPPSKPYGVTDQTQRMSHGISDNGW